MLKAQAPLPAILALHLIVILALLSPWPIGSVAPVAERAISLAALATSALVFGTEALSGRLPLPSFPVWPIAGFVALAAAQLVPLPPPLHALVASGSHGVWRPTEPEAAALLGTGWRPVSVDPEATARGVLFVGGLAALGLASVPALSTARLALRASVAVTFGGLAVAVYGIVARTLFGPLLFGRYPVPTVNPFGPFVSKNHFAGNVDMAAILAFGLATGLADHERKGGSRLGWMQGPRAVPALLAAGASMAMALAILVSLSRGGLVSLAAGAVALLSLRWTVRRSRGRSSHLLVSVGVVGAVGIGLVALVPPEARERMESLAGATREQSGSFRLETWRDALSMAAASPLVGHGLGAFADAFPRFKRGYGTLRVEHAESDYLETLDEGGVVGLGLALAATYMIFSGALRGLRRSEDRLLRGIGIGALAGVAALLVHSGFDFNLRIPSNAVLLTFLVAAAAGAAGPPRPAPSRALGFGLAVAVALALVALIHLPVMRGETTPADLGAAAVMGNADARRLRLARAEESLVAVLRRRPADAEAWFYLGWVRAAGGNPAAGRAFVRHAVALDPSRLSALGPDATVPQMRTRE